MTSNRVISYLILLLLLVLRISQSVLVLIHDDVLAISSTSDPLTIWLVALYGLIIFGSFAVIAVVIALNRDDLQRLNIDVFYVIVLLIAGILGFYELPYNCFSAVAVTYLIYAWLSKKIRFGIPDHSAVRISLWIVGIFAVAFLVLSNFLNFPKIQQNAAYFVSVLIPGSICEEAIYRGLLYMFLNDMKFGESKILYTQAFFFWISHVNYLFSDPAWFWIFTPAMGLTLGYVVLRTKSIGVSAMAHVLMNILSVSRSLSV